MLCFWIFLFSQYKAPNVLISGRLHASTTVLFPSQFSGCSGIFFFQVKLNDVIRSKDITSPLKILIYPLCLAFFLLQQRRSLGPLQPLSPAGPGLHPFLVAQFSFCLTHQQLFADYTSAYSSAYALNITYSKQKRKKQEEKNAWLYCLSFCPLLFF